jgi:hypothetical protein
MSQITWNEIIGNTTTSNLAKKVNRRFLYMSEEDILFIFQQFERADRIIIGKETR